MEGSHLGIGTTRQYAGVRVLRGDGARFFSPADLGERITHLEVAIRRARERVPGRSLCGRYSLTS
jgi:hypothetical protein